MAQPQRKLPAVAEILEDFLARLRRQSTRVRYKQAIAPFLSAAAIKTAEDLAHLTTSDVAYHVDYLRKSGAAPSTINVALIALRRFADFAKAEYALFEKNPADAKSIPGERVANVSRSEYLTEAEIERLLSTCEDPATGSAFERARDRAILVLGITDGLRVSEIVALKIGDRARDGDIPVLILRATKGADFARVKVHPLAGEAIDAYLVHHPTSARRDAFLFVTRSNRVGKASRLARPLTRQFVHVMIKKRVRLAKIDKRISAHSLRHSCATLALKNGAPIVKVQAHLRHKDPKTTIRYYREFKDLTESAVDFVKLTPRRRGQTR